MNENKLPPVVWYSKEYSSFIEGRGSCMNGEWFVIPFVFQKVGDGLYIEWLVENLPEGILKDISHILPNRPTEK